jgi:hypothetical protein
VRIEQPDGPGATRYRDDADHNHDGGVADHDEVPGGSAGLGPTELAEGNDSTAESAAMRTPGERHGDYDPTPAGLENLRQIGSAILQELRIANEHLAALRTEKEAGRLSAAQEEELTATERLISQQQILLDSIDAPRRGGGKKQPPSWAVFVTAQAQTIGEAVEESRGQFRGSLFWEKVWRAAEKKMRWLLPALAALTDVREMSVAGTLGTPVSHRAHSR